MLNGQTVSATKESVHKDKKWNWLMYPGLKKETESTIFAAQEQALWNKLYNKHHLQEKCLKRL